MVPVFNFVVAWTLKERRRTTRWCSESRVSRGERRVWERLKKPRQAKDDDQWLVGHRWVSSVTLPEVANQPVQQCKVVVWGVGKGDVWAERSEQVIHLVSLGIGESKPVVKEQKPKGPPKKKRRLKKLPSNTVNHMSGHVF